jgi:serine/threonine protein kinase
MAVALEVLTKAVATLGLVSANELQALVAALPEAERPRDGEALAALLQSRGKLTPFQSQHLLAGRAAALAVGEYVLVERIGAGGMGQVFKAAHRRMQRIVALKMMSPAAMKDEASVRRFQREVRAAARLEHPHIVTAYDAGTAGNTHYLVMQFVDGGDLANLVKTKGRLPVAQAVEFTAQAAGALAYAHREGIVHRDIKPANLLLDKRGQVKVLDMGLARVMTGDEDLTGSEQVMGTVDYMSPEQATESHSADGRSDIYSLGCTLWYLLTAKRLFDGESAVARLIKHRDTPPPSLLKERDDAPWSLEQALHKMVAKRPEERFESMEAVLEALDAFRGGEATGGMGSNVLRNAELASFLQGMGSRVQQSGASGVRPGSSGALKTAAAGGPSAGDSHVLPASDSALLGSPGGSSPGGKQPSSLGHGMPTHIAAGSHVDTDASFSPPAAGSPASIPHSAARGRGPGSPPGMKRKTSPKVYVFAAAGVALVVGAAALFALRKSPSAAPPPVAAKSTAPAGVAPSNRPANTAPIAAPRPTFALPVLNYAAERRAAEWALAKGGAVKVVDAVGSVREIKDRKPLPPGDWRVRSIDLRDKLNTGDGETVLLQPLSEIDTLILSRSGVSNKCLPHIGRLPTLVSLELNDVRMKDDDVDFLAGLTRLTKLVVGNTQVSETGLAKLKHLPLRHLEFGSIVAGSQIGAVLATFTRLETLRLFDAGLTDAGLQPLGRMPELRYVTLRRLAFGNGGLSTLATLGNLRELILEDLPSVSATGVQALASLPQITKLEFKNMAGVRDALPALQSALPNTEVIYDGARVAPRAFPKPDDPPGTKANELTAAEQAAGWRLLFDGRSFEGWKVFRSGDKPRGWWVVDGQMRADANAPYLVHDGEFEQFELHFEFRSSLDGNGGVVYWVDAKEDPPVKSGLQFELRFDEGKLGALIDVGPQTGAPSTVTPGAWYRGEIATQPGRTRHRVLTLDGQVLHDREYVRDSDEFRRSSKAKDPYFWSQSRGQLTLQAVAGSVAYRNLKIRETKPK